MRRISNSQFIVPIAAIFLAWVIYPAKAADLGTAFTYQGRLVKNGTPITSVSPHCDFTFGLFDVPAGGSHQGTSPQAIPGVAVTNGLFTVNLNFGPDGINGQARWLDITVQCPGDAMATTLIPRQELKPAPHALALPGLYTIQDAFSPNLIGGRFDNVVSSGVSGATIAGGGAPMPDVNRVTDTFGTVGGGCTNRAGDDAGTTFDAQFATVSGGFRNTASGFYSTIGGGIGNTASELITTIAGGDTNTASGDRSTVGGGFDNEASGGFSSIAGGGGNTASGYGSTIGGGFDNVAIGETPTVAGGRLNTANGDRAVVGGGESNLASGVHSTIGGGNHNQALAAFSTIAGGGPSEPRDPTGSNNRVFDDYGTIGGGGFNRAGSDDADPLTAFYATIGGGSSNTASNMGSTVGGGAENTASEFVSAVGGGGVNTASGPYSTVGGGGFNTASGFYSTVPGGGENIAGGSYSFAAGFLAKVRDAATVGDSDGDQGTFMWADASTFTDFTSDGPNRFLVRASGGTKIYSNSAATVGVQLTAGGNSWGMLSDRNAKENLTTIDPREVLQRLADMPITIWNLKSQISDIKHIGPMAQDFHAAFGVGESDTHISSSDADGVALAAIQGLHQIVQEKECHIAELEARNYQLQSRLDRLESLVGTLVEREVGDHE